MRSPSRSTLSLVLFAAALLVAAPLAAQGSGTSRGRVTVAGTMRPLSGAQLSIPGTGRGSLSNASGEFLLVNVPAGSHTVRAQMIGFGTAERPVTVAAGQTATVEIQLAEQALALDEVVVTGTAGAARRREIGHTISQIDLSNVPEPVVSTDALLQGRATGLTVTQNSGGVGGGASIRLRGNVSATMSNQPLIYVDGVRIRSEGYPKSTFPVGYSGNSDNSVYSPLNDINPNEIERVEVIKGPAATTLFGTEAAAGVIQIFTKRGSQGAARWTAQVDAGIAHVNAFGPTVGFEGDPLVVPANEVNPHGTVDFMYLDPWLRDAPRQRYSLAVSGGAEDIQYYLSGTLADEDGVLPNDHMRQYNVRGNFTFSPIRDLQLQWNTAYSNNNLQQTPAGGTAAGLTLNASRRDRNYVQSADPAVIGQVLSFDLRKYIDHFTTGLTATYAPMENLTNRVTLGSDLAQQENRGVMPYGFPTQPLGSIHDQKFAGRNLTFDYVGTFGFPIASELKSSFSWGAQAVSNETSTTTAASRDFPGPGQPTVSSGATKLGYEERMRVINAGFFFQNVFDFKDRYFLTGGIRFDGNSAFGSNLGLQAYPKVSASYVVSDEPFWNDAWGTMKLRAAYGEAGRAPGAFDAVQTWSPVSWGNSISFLPNNLGNADLGPERTGELEVGFDASVLADRVQVVFTYYDQETRDALFNVRQVPSEGGWGSQLKNVGTLQNRGLELSVDAAVLRSERLTWEVGGSVSTNYSKTLDLGGAAPFSLGSYGWIVEGESVPVMRGYCIENPDEIAEPRISTELCNIGPNSPTHTYIGTTRLELPRGISLSTRGEYQGGHFGQALLSGEGIVRGIRWPSCFNAYPALDAGDKSQLTAKVRAMCQSSLAKRDYAMYPLDFFRLREVSLNAPLPFRIGGVQSANLTLSGQNLWMWRKAQDSFVDPETSGGFTDGNTGMQQKVRSVEGSIPIPAVYLVSLRFTF